METVQKFTYVDNRISAAGGCVAAVTGRTKCWWVNKIGILQRTE